MEHLENLEIPFLSQWHSLLPSILPIPTALPQSHRQTSGFTQQNKTALLRALTLVKAAPLLTIGTREKRLLLF